MEDEQKPERWTKKIFQHFAQEPENAVSIFDFPESIVEKLPDEIVNAAGGEETVESAKKSELCALFEMNRRVPNSDGEPDGGERAGQDRQ